MWGLVLGVGCRVAPMVSKVPGDCTVENISPTGLSLQKAGGLLPGSMLGVYIPISQTRKLRV